MRLARLIAAVLGAALLVVLVVGEGGTSVLKASAAVGWGIVPVSLFECVPLALKAQAWSLLIPSREARGHRDLLLARWIRQSVSQLLPVAQVGGDLVGARVLWLRGVSGTVAGAATVVDLTLGASSQVLFTLLGVLALAAVADAGDLVEPVLWASVALLLGLGGFVALQTRGLFGVFARRAHTLSHGFVALVGSAERLDAEVRRLYADGRRLGRNACWQFLAQLAGTGEVLLICLFLGIAMGPVEAFVLQSLSRGIRSAAFMVPAGLGVQEGGIMLLTAALGFDAGAGLTLALVKRAREILVGLPALVVWQRLERAA